MRARLTNMATRVLVLALSLLLLTYVGLLEAYKNYPQFEIDKVVAQAEIVQNSMETFLLAGWPLEQFPKFSTLTQSLLESDQSIAQIRVINLQGQVVFSNAKIKGVLASQVPGFFPSKLHFKESYYHLMEDGSFYQVILPLRKKLKTVGQMEMAIPKAAIAKAINAHFASVVIAIAVFLLVQALIAFFGDNWWQSQGSQRVDISYQIIFFIIAMVLTLTLTNLYTKGIDGQASAMANSLSQRLNAAFPMQSDISDFGTLKENLIEYKKNHLDISFIALTAGETIAFHNDPKRIGTTWKPQPDDYDYQNALNTSDSSSFAQAVVVRVGIPKLIVYARIWHSLKNFFVLLIASGFFAVLFSNLLRSFTGRYQTSKNEQRRNNKNSQLPITNSQDRDFLLNLIEPFYFLGVFVEALNVSFLPQYFKKLATVASANPSLVSMLFTVFFAFFVLALLPSGQYAQSRGVKPLLVGGAMLSAVGMLLMAFVTNFYAMFVIRAIGGFGQGMLYIGVQSYILELATNNKKTQGAAIIVFSYNGGMIAGSAFGSLLATYAGIKSVFAIAGTICLFALWYAQQIIPRLRINKKASAPQQKIDAHSRIHNWLGAVKDFQFVSSVLLIGIPTKGILTGVTVFALPLLLSRQNYAQEEIGQILMFYAAGVLISSSYISRLVDRIGKTGEILCLGSLGSGVGLILIGLMGCNQALGSQFSYLPTLFLIAGLTTLGLAHGFIHAPIVTYITDSQTARVFGKSSAASLYRLLERIGHVIGPIIVGQLLLLNQESELTISWIGIATIFSGLVFAYYNNIVRVRSLKKNVSSDTHKNL